MRILVATLSLVAALLFLTGNSESRTPGARQYVTADAIASNTPRIATHGSDDDKVLLSNADLSAVVNFYCVTCHSERLKTGNLVLEGYQVDSAAKNLATTEKMIRKLRTQMMPPPPAVRKLAIDTSVLLVETLERIVDTQSRLNPGTRTFQRLNRPEYERAVLDLLGLQVNAGNWLPLDTKSANFDNIADVQSPSATLLSAYLNAASAVSLMAVGDRNAFSTTAAYKMSVFNSQHPWNHVPGAPYGTRGGIVTEHNFPADGYYQFRMDVSGPLGIRLEDIDISIDNQPATLVHYERGIERTVNSADNTLGADYIRSAPVLVKAGQHKVSAAFIRKAEGPYEDLIKPHDWSLAGNGSASAGTTQYPHMTELAIVGPTKITGLSETASRKLIFSCKPTAPAKEKPCAQEIITRIATKAYRRPVTDRDMTGLMSFYDAGSKAGGFEGGVQMALQAVLASPHFFLRVEGAPDNVKPGADYRLADDDLASRLSFFLWGTLPDAELAELARKNKLHEPKELEKQVRRMLADRRSLALGDRFAAQWLRLQDIDKVRPDAFWFPDFDQQLADAMKNETILFFNDILKNDRSVRNLFTADYTFVNEGLAKHYGIPGVSGKEFRRVNYPDETRRGLLGQGSMLVQTSQANRTSPVLRGKWVMEVLLGTPPPPPPPMIPDLEETETAIDGKTLTTRERMEIHRRNPTCRTCHQYMDPMGLALDNFDVTGRWREREFSMPLDTKGTLYDGQTVTSTKTLTDALMKRPIPLMRAFAENLMAYGLGRRIEDYDQPTIRAIVKQAESQDYRLSSFIMGIVKSSAFLNKRADGVADGQTGSDKP